MKLNWINVIATLLIVAGVCLLVARKQPARQAAGPATRAMTDEEVRAHFYASFEKTLGRPLNDVEKQMITTTRDGTSAHARLSEPLLSRVALAERERKAIEENGAGSIVPGSAPVTIPGNNLPPAATMPAVPAAQ